MFRIRQVFKSPFLLYPSLLALFADDRDCVLPNGQLDRGQLARVVFANAGARRTMNKITHLPIAWEVMKRLVINFIMGSRLVVLDVPLLFETGMHKICWKVIVVHVTYETQSMRLMARDNITQEEASNKIQSQLPLDAKRDRADYIIDNNHSRASTSDQIETIHHDVFQPVLLSCFSIFNLCKIIFSLLLLWLLLYLMRAP
eukprot:TRINITY_DN9082_c0_g1_i3.p1 TRINITY_DN9082_c0_g1~~TRINITY_DN9082_c0_g1_i3.p1  ORF type:complete len:201 (+),score=26.79 TRINITY_DN9082_c0_g1_i3:154-756(+)